MKLRYRTHFDSAHRLENYEGDCFNLHGHRWEVLVEIEAEQKEDMIIDFKEIKDVIKTFDHTAILKNCPENEELIKVLEKMECFVYDTDYTPTAENIVRDIYRDIVKRLQKREIFDYKLKVTLWESPGAGISYEKLTSKNSQ